jgi:hypothetical protein
MVDIVYLISLELIIKKHMKINQIYHTSHCGSTLMATLLANSTTVYCEPPWTSSLLNGELELDNVTIKFGSGWCPFSNQLPGKKVFLYRKLKHHLFKIKSSHYIDSIISTKYEHHLNHCHSSLKKFQFQTDLEKIAFMWLNNVQWVKEVNDVLWIESNSFFENKKETMNLVCDHFKLAQVGNFELANVYVKSFGLIGNEKAINEAEIPNLGTVKTLYPSFGVVETDLVLYDNEINDKIIWVENVFPEIREFLY